MKKIFVILLVLLSYQMGYAQFFKFQTADGQLVNWRGKAIKQKQSYYTANTNSTEYKFPEEIQQAEEYFSSLKKESTEEQKDRAREIYEHKYWWSDNVMKKEAKAGNANWQYWYARLLCRHNRYVPTKNVIKWYQASEAQNYPPAIRTMGELYRDGCPAVKIPKDEQKAKEYFDKLMQYDLGEYYYVLSENYEKGMGVPKDSTRAIQYLIESANNGCKDALKQLSEMYLKGKKVEKNPMLALWYHTLICTDDDFKYLESKRNKYDWKDTERGIWNIKRTWPAKDMNVPEYMLEYWRKKGWVGLIALYGKGEEKQIAFDAWLGRLCYDIEHAIADFSNKKQYSEIPGQQDYLKEIIGAVDYPRALYKYGRILYEGERRENECHGPGNWHWGAKQPADKNLGGKQIKIAADQGYVPAMLYLADNILPSKEAAQMYFSLAQKCAKEGYKEQSINFFRKSLDYCKEEGYEAPTAEMARFFAYMYEKGEGVSEDRSEATKWYAVAQKMDPTGNDKRLQQLYAEDCALVEQEYRNVMEIVKFQKLDGQVKYSTRASRNYRNLYADRGISSAEVEKMTDVIMDFSIVRSALTLPMERYWYVDKSTFLFVIPISENRWNSIKERESENLIAAAQQICSTNTNPELSAYYTAAIPLLEKKKEELEAHLARERQAFQKVESEKRRYASGGGGGYSNADVDVDVENINVACKQTGTYDPRSDVERWSGKIGEGRTYRVTDSDGDDYSIDVCHISTENGWCLDEFLLGASNLYYYDTAENAALAAYVWKKYGKRRKTGMLD